MKTETSRHAWLIKAALSWKSDQCIAWPYGRSGGYGVVRVNGDSLLVSRVVWELFNGPIPDGRVIRHSCDNPPCFNERHLIVGTVGDNNADCLTRGRHRAPHGVQHPLAKLTNEMVAEMRSLHVPGVFGCRRIARRFPMVSVQLVKQVLNNRVWRHVNG